MIFNGTNLSEEVVTKATSLFETAVVAKANEVIEKTYTDLREAFNDEVETFKNDHIIENDSSPKVD